MIRTSEISAVASTIAGASCCALIAHVSPDGDTLGSTLALSLALSHLGIRHDVYCEDVVPQSYAFMPGVERVMQPPKEPAVYPLAVSVDVSDHHRLGHCGRIFDAAKETIVIDHHQTNPRFGDQNLVAACSATGEIILAVIHALHVPLTLPIAENLYVAISTDTGNFNYSTTDGRAMRAAAELLDAGVDVSRITEILYRQRSPQKTLLLGRGISHMQFRLEGRIAILTLTQEDYALCGATDSDSEGLVNYGIECEGVQAAIMARDTGHGIKFSLRSRGAVDVGSLAAALGGGGHSLAAGITLKGTLHDMVELVFAAIVKELK